MDIQLAAGGSRRFDLTAAAGLADGYNRSRRLASTAMLVLMTGFGVFGLALLLTDPKVNVPSWLGPIVIAGAGFGLAAVVCQYQPRRGPRTLILRTDGLSLEDIPGSKSVTLLWDDPKLRISLYDFRGFPEFGTDHRPRPSDFVLQVPRAPYAQIPDEAYESIIEQAHTRGLNLVRRKQGIPGSPTPVLRLTIRARPP